MRVTRQNVTIEPLPADFVAQAHEIQATRKKAIGADPAPREDRQRDPRRPRATHKATPRSEEHTSELKSLMRISYAVFCLKKNKNDHPNYLKVNSEDNNTQI